MLLVGLTGGIASGKTLVSKKLLTLGAFVIDADEISREAMVPRTDCWNKIVKAFGKEILCTDSTIDRKKLAQLVFADAQKRNCLNRIAHPEIMQRIAVRLAAIKEEAPDTIAIVDAALLVETGAYKNYDKLIVVYAPEEIQEKRLIERDGMNREEARRRINAQGPINEKLKVADYVIRNEGTLNMLYKTTENVFSSLRTISDAHNRQPRKH